MLSVLLVLILLFFYAVPFSRPPGGWPLGELLVNYQGGFVRRGLLGEVVFRISLALDLSPLFLLRWLFVALSVVNILVFVSLSAVEERLLKRATLLLAPVLLLFPVYDLAAYGRKDLITTALLGVHALIAQQTFRRRLSFGTYGTLLAALIAPLLMVQILTHDVQIFFIPFHLAITVAVLQDCDDATPRRVLWPYVPVAAVSVLPVLFNGTKETAIAVCNSWHALIDQFGYCRVNSDSFSDLVHSGMKALGWDLRKPIGYTLRTVRNREAASLFFVAAALSLVPYFIFYRMSDVCRAGAPVPDRLQRLLRFSLLAPLALFIIGGWDFGRWLHLITSGLFALTYCRPRLVQSRVRFDSVLEGAGFRGLLPYLLLIGLYVGFWYVPHCCEPSSLQGGMFEAASASFRLLFGG